MVAEEAAPGKLRWTTKASVAAARRRVVASAPAGTAAAHRPRRPRRAANVLRVHRGRPLRLSFQAGIFLEGMRKYYEISGDEEALDYIEQSVDRLIAENRKGGTTAQAHSLMYLQTGNKKYLEAALENLPQSGNFGNPWKDYALAMRNAAMCIGDLHRASRKTP